MSSSIVVTFDPGGQGVSLADWKIFCDDHGLEYKGGTTYRVGQVEIDLGDGVREVGTGASVYRFTFSTFWMGPEMPQVAELARTFWLWFGGAVQASPELMALFVRGVQP